MRHVGTILRLVEEFEGESEGGVEWGYEVNMRGIYCKKTARECVEFGRRTGGLFGDCWKTIDFC